MSYRHNRLKSFMYWYFFLVETFIYYYNFNVGVEIKKICFEDKGRYIKSAAPRGVRPARPQSYLDLAN